MHAKSKFLIDNRRTWYQKVRTKSFTTNLEIQNFFPGTIDVKKTRNSYTTLAHVEPNPNSFSFKKLQFEQGAFHKR